MPGDGVSPPPAAAFELATPTRIVFGAGAAVREVPAALKALGVRRVLLVTGRSPARADSLRAALASQELVTFRVTEEPTVELVRAGVAAATGCQAVVGLGGGSALDGAKAIAALAANGGDPLEYLEVIGRGRKLERASLPFLAIPTTAGTGTEVTRNAVLASPQAGVKASLRSPLMLPTLAVVDPELLVGLPPAVVASSGLDALSQLIEPFLSARANPITDALAREGIRRSARSLRRAVTEGLDPVAREDLALASLMGGLCLANAGLGAVHGFAAPAGGMFAAPHGAVCAALLAPVLEVNLRALEERAPEHPARARFAEVAALVTGDPAADAAAGIAWVRDLVTALDIPPLGRYGLTPEAVPELIERAKVASSMRANPITLTDEELRAIVLRAL
jgi:alcohol dehydrogenase class IV